MADPVAERAVQVRPVVDGVHLVDAQPVEAVGVGLDRVEHRDRFAVGQRHDDVGPRIEVVDDRLGRHQGRWPTGPAGPTRCDASDVVIWLQPLLAASISSRFSAAAIVDRTESTASGLTEIESIPSRTRCSANLGESDGA